jgi:hypothetical protein
MSVASRRDRPLAKRQPAWPRILLSERKSNRRSPRPPRAADSFSRASTGSKGRQAMQPPSAPSGTSHAVGAHDSGVEMNTTDRHDQKDFCIFLALTRRIRPGNVSCTLDFRAPEYYRWIHACYRLILCILACYIVLLRCCSIDMSLALTNKLKFRCIKPISQLKPSYDYAYPTCSPSSSRQR